MRLPVRRLRGTSSSDGRAPWCTSFRHLRDRIAAVATAMVCILSAFNGIEDLVKDLFGTPTPTSLWCRNRGP